MVNFPIPDWCQPLLSPQDEHSKKRLLLLRAAFDVIAEAGFEGLRTRAVATLAGVNIATLHYYFPTKQNLIEGLAEFLGAKFLIIHGPQPAPSGYPALDRLRQEFSDGRYYVTHEPNMLLLLQELVVRGRRDPEVQKVVDMMNFHWQQEVEQIVLAGISSGVFRNDVAPQDLLALLMSVFSGKYITGRGDIDKAERAIETLLLSDKIKQELKRSSGAEVQTEVI
jgi:TetR/AcrR family transcriptional regulator, regulator of cefoperazone and chloramphenicol sensitivity